MIRMDSLVVVTRFEMNAVACMRIPFVSELKNSLSCVYSVQIFAAVCKLSQIVLFRFYICKLAETICNLLMAANF